MYNDLILYDVNESYENKYDIDASLHVNTSVKTMDLSVRLSNVFDRNGIENIKDLLKLNDEILLGFNNFGKGCLEELHRHLNKFKLSENNIIPETIKSKKNVSYYILSEEERCFIECLLLDGNSCSNELTNKLSPQLKYFKEAIEIVGNEVCLLAYLEPEKIKPLFNTLNMYHEEVEYEMKLRKLVDRCINEIPHKRLNQYARPYIVAFTSDDEKMKCLMDIFPEYSKIDYILSIRISELSKQELELILKFLDWCKFDLNNMIDDLFENLCTTERTKIVIKSRASNETLEAVGAKVGVTRERVRQIEAKVQRKFQSWLNKNKIASIISATRDGDEVLTCDEIRQVIGVYSVELTYLLKRAKSKKYFYNKVLDVFIMNPELVLDNINEFIDNFPDDITEDELQNYIKLTVFEMGIPEELVIKVIEEQYNKSGCLYHRSKLKLSLLYERILKSDYPNGIKLNDFELDRLRNKIYEQFGSVKLPNNNRAISARLSSIGILCDRGTYKAKQDHYISQDLVDDIHNFIFENDKPVLLTNAIFVKFRKKLEEKGIKNKYYLHGILREIFGDEFSYRRDYISKDKSFTSLYESIVSFIREYDYPVTKKEIESEFPGITDVMISLAVSDSKILNYFGEYIHVDKLKIDKNEIRIIRSHIDKIISDGKIHHIRDLFKVVDKMNPAILRRLGVISTFQLYSVIEYYFENDYSFKRPYFSNSDIIIDCTQERLREFVFSFKEVSVNNITKFSKENGIQIYSILDLINSFNDKYIMRDKFTIILYELLGINDAVVSGIEKQIYNELGNRKCMIINELVNVHKFPKINIEWNEWIIYSIINRWDTELEVATSSRQFSLATPIVGIKGQFSEEDIQEVIQDAYTGALHTIDNLDLIDELISEEEFDIAW